MSILKCFWTQRFLKIYLGAKYILNHAKINTHKSKLLFISPIK